MKKIALFLLALSFIFSCNPPKKFYKTSLRPLTLDMLSVIPDTTSLWSDTITSVEFIRGPIKVKINPGTACVVQSDTVAGRAIGKVYFGIDSRMKTSENPFLIYEVDEETKEFRLRSWTEHPDSVAFDSKKATKGSQKFWKLEKGQDSKIMVDTLVYVLPGRSPKT